MAIEGKVKEITMRKEEGGTRWWRRKNEGKECKTKREARDIGLVEGTAGPALRAEYS